MPFPLYDEMHSLIDGVVATGSSAFQAGALLTPKPSQLVIRKEHSIEWTNSQSVEQRVVYSIYYMHHPDFDRGCNRL